MKQKGRMTLLRTRSPKRAHDICKTSSERDKTTFQTKLQHLLKTAGRKMEENIATLALHVYLLTYSITFRFCGLGSTIWKH